MSVSAVTGAKNCIPACTLSSSPNGPNGGVMFHVNHCSISLGGLFCASLISILAWIPSLLAVGP